MKFILLLLAFSRLFLREFLGFPKFRFAVNNASYNWYCGVVKFECFQVHCALIY